MEPSSCRICIVQIINIAHVFFRNGCICCGSSAVLTHLPLQSLPSISLFLLDPLSISDPVHGGRRFLLVPVSIPAESTKLRPAGSSCGGLRCLNYSNGDIGHQYPPYINTVRKFVLHSVWHVTGCAGFQGDSTSEAWQHCCHGDILFGTATNSCGRYKGHWEQGWLCKMEEDLTSIPVASQRFEVSPSNGKILKLPINTCRVFNMNPSNTEKEENKRQ